MPCMKMCMSSLRARKAETFLRKTFSVDKGNDIRFSKSGCMFEDTTFEEIRGVNFLYLLGNGGDIDYLVVEEKEE